MKSRRWRIFRGKARREHFFRLYSWKTLGPLLVEGVAVSEGNAYSRYCSTISNKKVNKQLGADGGKKLRADNASLTDDADPAYVQRAVLVLNSAKNPGILFHQSAVFLVCWVPFFTCNILEAISLKLEEPEAAWRPGVTLFLTTTWLGYINSFMNPIIYTVWNMEFRKAFRKILATPFTAGNSIFAEKKPWHILETVPKRGTPTEELFNEPRVPSAKVQRRSTALSGQELMDPIVETSVGALALPEPTASVDTKHPPLTVPRRTTAASFCLSQAGALLSSVSYPDEPAVYELVSVCIGAVLAKEASHRYGN
ncbi:unnamed protein product [Notodromas monacha]|uniref:G-protein coupled receptors family 1 profile domain-containing protein n=1 Tax=Notodromas monacha TaxID=399045 RepID=A0A7R9BDN1_9CRUS|nr:unnamed protein product [Notodromas monacha]CAG0912242.1 unnamed protein product [Notodromas monacha]